MKKILQALNDFSQKLSRFENSSEKEFVAPESEDRKLQKKIKLSEEEKNQLVLDEFEKYKSAISKETEEDEEEILEALKLFKESLEEKNNFPGFSAALCEKEEYLHGGKLIYLYCWLSLVQNEKDFMPLIFKTSEDECLLSYKPFDDYIMNYEEKAVFGIIMNKYSKKGKK